LLVACGRPSKPSDRNPPPTSSIADAGATPADAVAVAIADARPYVRDEEAWDYLATFSDEHLRGTARAEKWLLAHPDRARPELLRCVGQTWWNQITSHAYRLLGVIGHEDDVPVLRAVLMSGAEREAHYAAMALASMPHESAFEALEEGVGSPEPEVTGTSIFALGERGDERARKTIERRLADDLISVRRQAIYALSKLGVEPSRALLEQRVRVETDTGVLGVLAEVLGAAGSP